MTQTKQQQKINKMYSFTTKGSTQEELLKTIKENNELIDLNYKIRNEFALFIMFLILLMSIITEANTDPTYNGNPQKWIVLIIIIIIGLNCLYYFYKFIKGSLEFKKIKDLDYK